MRDRTYAHRNGFDCFCHTLLCRAAKELVRHTALGYECFIFTETYEHISKGVTVRQSVYYLAHKRLNRPTRKERGCDLMLPDFKSGIPDGLRICATPFEG